MRFDVQITSLDGCMAVGPVPFPLDRSTTPVKLPDFGEHTSQDCRQSVHSKAANLRGEGFRGRGDDASSWIVCSGLLMNRRGTRNKTRVQPRINVDHLSVTVFVFVTPRGVVKV